MPITVAVTAATIAEIDAITTALVPEPPFVSHLSILANRLHTAMDRCPTGRMTVATLAATSGVSETTIYGILNGARTCVTVDTASLIETALGYRPRTIFTDVTDKGATPGPRTEPRSRTTPVRSDRTHHCHNCGNMVKPIADCMDCGEPLSSMTTLALVG